jgi:hypothetical protein
MQRQIILLGPTSGAGAFTSVQGSALLGKLYAIEYRPGTIDTGASITVTCEADSSKPLLTKTSAGTANAWFYPRDLEHAVADGAALTGTTGGDRTLPILNGCIKVVVASGGSAMSGSLIVYYEDCWT